MPPAPNTPKPAERKPAERPATPVRWHWNSALAGALITAIFLGGLTFMWRRPIPPPIAIYAPPTPVVATPEPTAPAPLVIFISGAVQVPGVYEVPAGARIVDVLERGGGFTPDANVNAVNQAAPVQDGGQVYVPTVVEEPAAPPPGLTNVEPAGSTSSSASGVGTININTASAAELEQLPGIGPRRAQDIIAGRPFASVDDLERVPGIGPATLEKLRPLVTVE